MFGRWTGIVAAVGAVAFLLTFLTVLGGENDSPFGIGYPIGFLCLVIFSIATSVARYRGVGGDAATTPAGVPPETADFQG